MFLTLNQATSGWYPIFWSTGSSWVSMWLVIELPALRRIGLAAEKQILTTRVWPQASACAISAENRALLARTSSITGPIGASTGFPGIVHAASGAGFSSLR